MTALPTAPGPLDMTPTDTRGAFADIDHAAEPGRFVDLLDEIGALAAIRAYKRRSYDLLALRPGIALLDLGCGTGDDACALATRVGPEGRVIGVDFSETAVAEARRRAAGTALPVEFQVGDARRLDFPAAVFDGCRAERLLHHLDDPKAAMTELVRVARPGATVVVFEPDFGTALVDHPDRVLTRRLLEANCDTYQQGWMGRRLPGLFRAAGLIEISIEPVPVLLPDYAQGNLILALEGTVARAVDHGLVTPDAGATWLADLRAADTIGRFFGALTGFLVSGRKP